MLGVASRCVVAKSMAPAMQQKQIRSALSHVINLPSCRYSPFRLAASGFLLQGKSLVFTSTQRDAMPSGDVKNCYMFFIFHS